MKCLGVVNMIDGKDLMLLLLKSLLWFSCVFCLVGFFSVMVFMLNFFNFLICEFISDMVGVIMIINFLCLKREGSWKYKFLLFLVGCIIIIFWLSWMFWIVWIWKLFNEFKLNLVKCFF